jgi:tripartite-type tricarboxylate transporter receptor subunit TctC
MKKLTLTHWIFIALLLGIVAGAILNFQFPSSPAPTSEEAIQKLRNIVEQQGNNDDWKRNVKALLSDSTTSADQKYQSIAKDLAQVKF